MSHQRRRGVTIRFWKTITETDRRGNTVSRGDATNPDEVTGWVIPDRSARAEVPGQQQINVVRVGVPISVANDVSLWSRAEYMGRQWDIAVPPAYHRGVKRHTEHYSIELRERP